MNRNTRIAEPPLPLDMSIGGALHASDIMIRGTVTLDGGEFPIAGVTVIATMAPEEFAAHENADDTVDDTIEDTAGKPGKESGGQTGKQHSRQTTRSNTRLQLGRAVTQSDGTFAVETNALDARVSRWVCALKSCGEFQFRLTCLDTDGTLLHETEPLSYDSEASIAIELREPAFESGADTWKELGRRLLDAQTARIAIVAVELASLAPSGLFRDWTVARRLGMLGMMEQALLDPDNMLANAGVSVRLRQLESETAVADVREQLRVMQRPELLETLDDSITRARTFVTLRDINAYLGVDQLERGDAVGAINHYLKPDTGIAIDKVPWVASPLVGYRDYLRDRWIDHQRIEQQLGAPDLAVATRATMIARLNARFHQDFAVISTKHQPASQLLAGILLKILAAPTGTGYGFAVVPATIEAQGERSNGEYLDYLISLTKQSRAELENRYRLNLHRPEFERSNPVQQNIDTLQRFFTDSYQSVADPFPIAPTRKTGTNEPLISRFPMEGAGPFFLEYEEWLERESAFYPENHFDPRATYHWEVLERFQKTRELVWANSISIGDFIALPVSKAGKFIPDSGSYNHAAAKWQWVRNHVELWDLIEAAANEVKTLNYVGAEEKYSIALYWTVKLRDFVRGKDKFWQYDPAAFAKKEKNTDVSNIDALTAFERRLPLYFGHHYDAPSLASDLLPGNAEITDRWWGNDTLSWHGNKREIRYMLDYLQFRYLPAMLSEVQLAIGKYADAVRQLTGHHALFQQSYRWFAGPAGFNAYAAKPGAGGALRIGSFEHFTDGPLPYSSSSDQTEYPPPDPPTSVPTNRAELGYFRLKLGNACLEWADALYRTNQPDSIMRARELYKAVLFLHNEDPEITPHWERFHGPLPLPASWQKSTGNPAVVSQVNRGRLGFLQINNGLNYYAVSPKHVPPVRFRVLKESADRFAAGARGAQSDFLSYVQQLDTLTVNEMNARTMVAKASTAISIAQEQQKIAEFQVGEAQKQVDAINGAIAAKKAEIAKKDEFFEQFKDFAGGMVDSVSKLGEMAFAGEGDALAASSQQLSTGDVLKLGYKVGTATNVLGSGASALSGAAGVAGPFGAFLYAGVTSMGALADGIAKRAGELKQLQNVALPAAKALVDLKKRDVTIAQLTQAIAKADWQLGRDLLAYFAQRLLNRSFLLSMVEFSNRLMRRYLDLAGRTAWVAERALAFEQDRELGIIAFDYFPRNLRGVSGADVLQLHLAELEAARIQGLTQTIPIKQTVSLARDFPIAFGQLKSTGACRFATSEEPLRLVYPGVYGYRVRNITVGAAYAEPIQPHRGLLSNQGVSVLTRSTLDSAHTLVRYPDVLPLSEFRMREDMWVFDLPDETLLPFEGSGIETVWDLMLPRVGNSNGFESITDVMITFDMRANYSASLRTQHVAALPTSANRSVLVSANTMNPGGLSQFGIDGGVVSLAFDVAKATFNANELTRTTLNVVFMAVGLKATPFSATLSSSAPVLSEGITFEKGVALSNAGALSDGNGGIPLPLNTFVGLDANQTFRLEIDANANLGVDFTLLTEVMLLVEYEATY